MKLKTSRHRPGIAPMLMKTTTGEVYDTIYYCTSCYPKFQTGTIIYRTREAVLRHRRDYHKDK